MRCYTSYSVKLNCGVFIPATLSNGIILLDFGTFLPNSPVGMDISQMIEYREDLKKFMDKWHLWSCYCPRDPEKNHNQHDEGE